MSKTKKLFLTLMLVCTIFLVVGCKKNQPTTTATPTETENTADIAEVESAIERLNITNSSDVAGDFPLPKFFQGDTEKPITWTSEDTNAVDIREWDADDEWDTAVYYKAFVTLSAEAKNVKLTASITYKGITRTKDFTLSLVADQFVAMSNAAAKDAGAGVDVKITGTVIYTQGSNFVINDGTENIYVYSSKGTTKLGQTVEVSGQTAKYQTMIQIAKDSTVKKISSGNPEVDYASLATTYTIAEMNALDTDSQRNTSTLIKVTGQVMASEDSYTPYLLVNPVKPTQEVVGFTKYTSAASLEELESFVGKYVDCYVINYYYYATGSCWNVLLVDGTMALNGDGTYQMTDAEKVDATGALLVEEFNATEALANITLPTTNEAYGTTITWASNNADALSNAGVYGGPEKDTEVTLTATVTSGGVTKDFTMTVTAKSSIPVSTVYEANHVASGDKVKAQGKVAATYARGFLLQDATGTILVYLNATHEYEVGDIVSVYGPISVYNGVSQFTNAATIEEVEIDAFEMEMNINQLDGTALDAVLAAGKAGQYVSVTGTLAISTSGTNTYYNVTVTGAANATASISYPDAEALGLAALSGQTITVEGYVIGFSSKYVNIMATTVAAGTKTYDAPTAVMTVAEAGPKAKGTAVTVEGQVVSLNKKGFMLADATGTILVYQNAVPTVKVGQYVRVSGISSPYNGLYEIAAGTDPVVALEIKTLVNGVAFAGTATEMSATALDAYLTTVTTGNYVSVTGTLDIKGTYYNITVAGTTTAMASIYFPLDGAVAADLSGKTVVIEGFLCGVSSSKYVNISVSNIYEYVAPKELPISASFICTAANEKTAPEGWTLSVDKGSYVEPFYQSFRQNGEYVESPEFVANEKVTVAFTYYLNNHGTNGNQSSKIKITGYNASGAEVATFTSAELNSTTVGVENVTVLTANLVASTGEAISSVKIEFVKSGGGNIAFSTINISVTPAA